MSEDIHELHTLMGMLRSIDVGLIVLDKDFTISVWNDFMTNHSGVRGEHVIGSKLFDKFIDLPEEWFINKTKSVFLLNNSAFTTWEQRPYLFKFKNYRPITGSADFMYQNITFLPLSSADGTVEHLGIIIYDVTDVAVGKMQIEGVNNELKKLSRTDGLTKLNNRAFWEDSLINEFNRAQRTKESVSLIMFDIDHFKNVNDTYGHQAGDEVIRETARVVLETIRCTDIAGRYGGEEFGVILIDTDAKGSLIIAERLRERMEALLVKFEALEIKFTISIGIAEYNDEIKDHVDWLGQSDKALYYCKENGRNQVRVYQPEDAALSG